MLHDSQLFYPKIFNPLQLGSTWSPYTWCEDKPTCRKFVFFVHEHHILYLPHYSNYLFKFSILISYYTYRISYIHLFKLCSFLIFLSLLLRLNNWFEFLEDIIWKLYSLQNYRRRPMCISIYIQKYPSYLIQNFSPLIPSGIWGIKGATSGFDNFSSI